MVIYLLGMEVGIVEAGVSFFHPGRTDEIGIDFGRRRTQGLGGGAFSSIGLNDVSQIFVAQGVVVEGMLHGLKDFGFAVEVHEFDHLFDLRGEVEFGFGKEFQVMVSRFPQGEEKIAVFKIGALGPGRKQALIVAGVFHQLIVLVRALVLSDELFLVIEKDPVVIGLEGKHP
jgi:hypothetical protein